MLLSIENFRHQVRVHMPMCLPFYSFPKLIFSSPISPLSHFSSHCLVALPHSSHPPQIFAFVSGIVANFLLGRFMATNVDPLTGSFIGRPQATSHHRIGIMNTTGDGGHPVAMELMAHIAAGHRCLIVPLSMMCTPLMPIADLSYDPLMCARCHFALNPYSRIDYHSALWACPFCKQNNPFPRSYNGIDENNLPVEIFPTHSTVKYIIFWNPISHGGFGLSPSSTTSQFSLLPSPPSSPDSPPPPHCQGQSPPGCRAFLRVCYGHLFSTGGTPVLKNEILHIVARLPENQYFFDKIKKEIKVEILAFFWPYPIPNLLD